MNEHSTPSPNVRVTLETKGSAPATLANHFYLAYLGSDVELVVGFLDIAELVQKRDAAIASNKSEVEVVADVVARIVMSAQSFPFLLAQVQEIAQRMGLPLPPSTAQGA
jgi:hypothetical protein